MTKRKPYKFSKKAGRYISTTKTGNREYYFKILKTIYPTLNQEYPSIKLDHNTTFGKYIYTQSINHLKAFRKIDRIKKDLELEIKKKQRIIEETEKLAYHQFVKKQGEMMVYANYRSLHFITKYSTAITFITSIILYFLFLSISVGIISFIAGVILTGIIIPSFLEKKQGFYEKIANIHEFQLNEQEKNSIIRIQNELEESENVYNKTSDELNSLIAEIKTAINKILNDDYLKFVLSDDFYNSTDWRKLRLEVLTIKENVCVICYSNENLAVDHIFPRSKYPDKALTISNLQILCQKCNSSKGNRF
jgi:methyl-accepting chemotaxis protein